MLLEELADPFAADPIYAACLLQCRATLDEGDQVGCALVHRYAPPAAIGLALGDPRLPEQALQAARASPPGHGPQQTCTLAALRVERLDGEHLNIGLPRCKSRAGIGHTAQFESLDRSPPWPTGLGCGSAFRQTVEAL